MFENEIRSDQSECGQWEREGNRSSSVTVVLVAHSAGLDLRAVSDRGVGGELDNSAGVLGIVGVDIQASTDNSSALCKSEQLFEFNLESLTPFDSEKRVGTPKYALFEIGDYKNPSYIITIISLLSIKAYIDQEFIE